jgi:hypothetical protein
LVAGRSRISGLIPRTHHDADLFDPRRGDFIDDDPERGSGVAIAIHQGLERQRALVAAGGSDNGLSDFHGQCL